MKMTLLISTAVLVLTCSALLAYEYAVFRQSTLEQTATLARIIATNSTAALAFRNQEDAEEVLSALKTEPHITAAALFHEQGNLFAKYPAEAAGELLPGAPLADGYRYASGYLQGFQAVQEASNRRLGTLYIRSDMTALYDRLGLYLVIVAGLMAASITLSYLLSRQLQRQISQPILELAETARAISERGDYSVRAAVQRQAAFNVLTSAFNRMLAQIAAQEIGR